MRKYLNILILASIFLVPMASILPMHGTICWYPQLLTLIFIGFVAGALLFWDTNKFISMFLIYAALSYIFVCNQTPRSLICLITGYGAMIFAYLVSISNVKVHKALLVLGILNFVYLILQCLNIDPIFIPSSGELLDRTVGFMGSRNQLGIFSACSGILLAYLSPWFLLLSTPILLVKCSSAFAGLLVGMSSYLFLMGNKKLGFLLIGALLISIPIFMHFKGGLLAELNERVQVWELSIEQVISGKMDVYESDIGSEKLKNHQRVLSNPLFGFGIGNFFVYSPSSQVGFNFSPWHRYEHAHNDLVEALFEFGYIGFGLIMLCISKIIADFISCVIKTKQLIVSFSALIGLSVCSLGVYVFHAPVSLFLLCLTLGLFYREVNCAKQSKIA